MLSCPGNLVLDLWAVLGAFVAFYHNYGKSPLEKFSLRLWDLCILMSYVELCLHRWGGFMFFCIHFIEETVIQDCTQCSILQYFS